MKRVTSFLACLGLLDPSLTANSITLTAPSIKFVGTETGTPVENWSNTAMPKTHDLNLDDRFGGAGYYQIMPAPLDVNFGESWGVDLTDPNDLGITLPGPPPKGVYYTLKEKPTFLTNNPVGGGGNCFIFGTNPVFTDPLGVSLLRQGFLAVSSTNFVYDGDNLIASSANAFSFTLSKAAVFRIGLAVGIGDGSYDPDYVSVSYVNADVVVEVSSVVPLNRVDGLSDMVFFDIAGDEGEEFTVNMRQTSNLIGVEGPIAFALVTFDQLPIPTLSYTQVGDDFILSWEQGIAGWVLESSTDLDATDSWEPVPGVANNSVSLPMTGVPKNFFRLRKNL